MSEETKFPDFARQQGCLACPSCHRPFDIGRDCAPEQTAFWNHYFSGPHLREHPDTAAHKDHLRKQINRARRRWRTEREISEALLRPSPSVRRKDASDRAHLKRTYRLTGAMIEEIAAALRQGAEILEPHYARHGINSPSASILGKLSELRSTAERGLDPFHVANDLPDRLPEIVGYQVVDRLTGETSREPSDILDKATATRELLGQRALENRDTWTMITVLETDLYDIVARHGPVRLITADRAS